MNVKKLDSTKIYWLDKEETVKAKLVGLDLPNGFGSVKYTFRVIHGGTGDIVYMDSNLPKTIHEVVEQKHWQFITPIAMKCTEEQFNGIKDKLVEMGYIFYGITFGEKYRYLSSNFAKDKRCITDLAIGSKYFKECSPIIFESFNPDLFLALAAMTDKEDGIKEEWWKCCADGSYQCQSSRHVLWKLNFRKATAQEIIEHFEKKEFVLPYAYMVCVNSKEEYLSVLEYARTKGEFKEDFNDSTPNAFPYYIGMEKNGSWSYNNRYISACDGVKITFDQFKKYVLKETEQSCQIISIPPTKQAALFDDRVEIADWKPKEGDIIFGVYLSPNGITYEKYEYFPHMEGLFDTGFIKRTESEAKQLVEKLKQAML